MTHQQRLGALQARGRLPGVVAGVLADGELAWTGAAGMGDVDQQYRIGSITKTMTAVAVLQLRDEGLVELDHPIGRYVPETGYAASTLRALLSHTSGMQSEPVGSWWERSPGTDFDALVAANDGSGAVAGPGEYYHYSNLGYALLGEAVARLRGASWWEVVRDRLLEPLGMSRTTYHPEAPVAQGYSVDHFAGTLTPEPHQDTKGMAPAGQAVEHGRGSGPLGAVPRRRAPRRAVGGDAAGDVAAAAAGGGLRTRLQLVSAGRARTSWGTVAACPDSGPCLFVDQDRRDGVVVLCNATTGLSSETHAGSVPRTTPTRTSPVPAWVPTDRVPDEVVADARRVVLGQHRGRAAVAERAAGAALT